MENSAGKILNFHVDSNVPYYVYVGKKSYVYKKKI